MCSPGTVGIMQRQICVLSEQQRADPALAARELRIGRKVGEQSSGSEQGPKEARSEQQSQATPPGALGKVHPTTAGLQDSCSQTQPRGTEANSPFE